MSAILLEQYFLWEKVPLGAIVATAELVGCHRMTGRTSIDRQIVAAQYKKNGQTFEVAGNELLFGDWTPGRYAWEIANVKVLDHPVKMRGSQGLWTVHDPEQVLKGA
jgi:hypothetical protein